MYIWNQTFTPTILTTEHRPIRVRAHRPATTRAAILVAGRDYFTGTAKPDMRNSPIHIRSAGGAAVPTAPTNLRIGG